MGSSFIAYGMIMVIMLQIGQAWLKRTGRSQEFWDSLIITVWGNLSLTTPLPLKHTKTIVLPRFHQHLHRTPLGQSLGPQRHPTHLHGHSLVVRWSPWPLALSR